MNGGTIRDANGTCCPGGNNADLTHGAVAESARHKVRTLTQPSKSSDATLSALTLSDINIGTFASGTTSYTAQVANSVSQTTVSPTVNHSGASHVVKLGGVTDSDGVVSLATGSNVITVEVTAEDGDITKTYTVTVTRSAQASTDATLSGLTLSNVNFGTFASGTTSYTADVANSVTETTVTPTVNHSGATYVIKLDGVEDADGVVSLAEGSNVITIEVTAEDDTTTRTYTVTVTRLVSLQQNSTDATLSALTLSGINFGAFSSDTDSYTASVANSVSQTTVTPTVNDSGASYVIKLDGVTDADGVVSLSVGSNVITVEVTAEDDETTQTYRNGHPSRTALDGRHAQCVGAERHRFRHVRLWYHFIQRSSCQQRIADDRHSDRERLGGELCDQARRGDGRRRRGLTERGQQRHHRGSDR